jgi:hypothetical protein
MAWAKVMKMAVFGAEISPKPMIEKEICEIKHRILHGDEIFHNPPISQLQSAHRVCQQLFAGHAFGVCTGAK